MSNTATPEPPRAKVACINWGGHSSVRAVSYLLVNGEAHADAYHRTWAEAIERANWLARAAHTTTITIN